MSEQAILVLDEGTTSTRALIFAPDGTPLGIAQEQLEQHYPRPGRVEHDAAEIWAKTLACARRAMEMGGGAQNIAAIGISNQRETVVAWDRLTGEPLARALVWQDRRTAGYCEQLREAGHEPALREATGLLLDPYFSATKMRWLLESEPSVAEAAVEGRLCFGTVESWLVFKLTGGVHISDAGNASRTLLLPLTGASWDPGLCDLFGVPRAALPEVTDNSAAFGETLAELFGRAIPITGLAGDQQSATIGQGCLAPGLAKATYGTGAFVLANKGRELPRSSNRLLGTVLLQQGGERHYALEGAIFVAGSLMNWLRDTVGLIERFDDIEPLARSVEDSGGVVVVPALSGLGAPHWRPEARGAISGLSFATQKAHIVRAALESIAQQTVDLADAFAADGAAWKALKIDGGMATNEWMAQDIADLSGLTVERPDFVETTALGAAMLAAVGAGIHPSLDVAVEEMIGASRSFQPRMDRAVRERRLAQWRWALKAL